MSPHHGIEVQCVRGAINGFAATNPIDLLNTSATAATLGAGDTLAIKIGASTVATPRLAEDYSAAIFNVASDGNGGTNITMMSGPAIGIPGAGSPLPPDHSAASSSGHRLASRRSA